VCLLDLVSNKVPSGSMKAHTRAMIAAATFAYLTGKKVAGIYDHSAGRDLRIAAEFRGDRLRGIDGDRDAKFECTLPEIYDAADKSFVSFEADGAAMKGYDRATSTFYASKVTDGAVQVYDYGEGIWFAYDVQDVNSAASYHRAGGVAR
jgi:hypothetical protein